MNANIAPIIYAAALIVFMALGLYHAHKLRENMRKPTLRELCRREYGDEFIRDYDTLNEGGVIGGFAETITFINMVEDVKEKYKDEWR